MANEREQDGRNQERRESLPVPRWEVREMIAQGIQNYDAAVALPRHNELKACMTESNNGIRSIQSTMSEMSGGVKALKWIALAIGLGSGLTAWAKLIHF